MSSHYEWGQARVALYQIVSRQDARAEWLAGLTSALALGIFNENGDGTVLEGEAGEILDYVDRLHAYTHRELDDQTEQETRPCAQCGDQVLILSSRDWCDGCEAITIPDEVWTEFLEREYLLNREHQGEVALSAVVGEILRLMQSYESQQQSDAG